MFSRKSEKRTIEGNEYTVTALGGEEGCEVYALLVKALASGLKGGNLGERLAAVLQGLDIDTFKDLKNRFAAVTTVRVGKNDPVLRDIFDVHFSARYKAMTLWLAFCLEVNFGDFLGGVLAEFKQTLSPEQDTELPSQTISSGPFGGSSTKVG